MSDTLKEISEKLREEFSEKIKEEITRDPIKELLEKLKKLNEEK